MRINAAQAARRAAAVLFALCVAFPLAAQNDSDPSAPRSRWYRSNKAGMALQEVSSKIVALHSDYCLEVASPPPEEIPENLKGFFKSGWNTETRKLYEKGQPSRLQWLFIDEKKMIRLASVFTEEGPEPVAAADDSGTETEDDEEDERRSAGFVDRYYENGLIEQEIAYFSNGEKETTDFLYRGEYLLRAETVLSRAGEEDKKLVTDNYRYNRSGSVRSIERIFHNVEPAAAEPAAAESAAADAEETAAGSTAEAAVEFTAPQERIQTIRIPLIIPRSAAREDFVSASPVYISGFIEEGMPSKAVKAVFTTDARGRTLTERREDESGNFIALIKYQWSGDRLAVISLFVAVEKKEEPKEEKTPKEDEPAETAAEETGENTEGQAKTEEETAGAAETAGAEAAAEEKPAEPETPPPPPVEVRRVEYSYDSGGDWTTEEDYVEGKLERKVTRSGNREIEELYMDGKLMLKAYWEDGRRIREESIRN